MPILEDNKPVSLTQREVAVAVAQAIAQTGLPKPSTRFRDDLHHIQIDPIIIEERVTDRRPGVQLQFEAEGEFGVKLNVDLTEFAKNPGEYLGDLFSHLKPMLRNGIRLRHDKQAMNAKIYDILTRGAANG